MSFAAYLRERLEYNSQTGIFVWRPKEVSRHHDKIWNSSNAGKIAGWINPKGYVIIRIDGKGFPAHRLAWIYMTGTIPLQEIDHKNRDTKDNSWNNLRLANRNEQQANRKIPSDNTTGIKGVRKTPNNTFRAYITFYGKTHNLGTYSTLEEATRARKDAEASIHKDFAA